ncbi:TPA: hypothetical protein N0F65_007940 [Lagenidium giganteum]|uniref:Uncharacterized protein n=1 Tax=Lagenidium giganteum TaxID=4803 RepID=A0AAV2YJJ5_9STRA|nr:TPA: hypothetical protein N0F65_007940 [Lagenidium giganteum]
MAVRRWALGQLLAQLLLLLATAQWHISSVHAMVLRRPWTSQHWCKSVESPRWPFAYQKTATQTLEWKGRTNPSKQDMRHQCAVMGVESKCHRCEDIACGTALNQTCAYQLQGVAWAALPKNIPTVTDVAWAVGGAHRYDYGSASQVCVFLSGGDCISPFPTDYSQCVVRCWGRSSGAIQVLRDPEQGNASLLPHDDADAADIWSYPKNFTGDGKPQGMVSTLAGSGDRGFLDGAASVARFNNPQDVAVDSTGVVYVADTDNHRIRRIDPVTKAVTTLAGSGSQGVADGAAANATFSFPTGIAVYEMPVSKKPVVYVADTGNHRIRKIVDGVVSCVAGLCGSGVESAIQGRSPARPHPGLADGPPNSSRYDSPMGIAVDSNGIVFVADTGNHLIRRIEPNGTTNTLAGTVAPNENVPGCVTPCLRGVAGSRDGNLTYAQFNSPRDVAVGPQSTVIVADGHRIRRINYDGTRSILETISSSNRVVTLAGSQRPGNIDGAGDEATFHSPAGVTVSADGRVYVVSPVTCKLRQLSTASLVARDVTCTTTASQVLLPSGCSSYEPSVDELFRRVSPATNNIYYNYRGRNQSDPVDGVTLPGRRVKDCTGTPPIDALETGDRSLALRDANNAVVADTDEDQEDGTSFKLRCPAHCIATAGHTAKVFGSRMYTDASSICLAAVHSGALDDTTGGLITMILERGVHFRDPVIRAGSTAHSVTSLDMAKAYASARLFSVHAYPMPTIEVQTIAGAASALLRSGCGFVDAMPPQEARFNGPMGIEIYFGQSPGRTQLLYIADARNNRIRQITAVCSKICENGGVCVAQDMCSCASGWTGDDCSIPVCQTCGDRKVCVGPNQCSCIPGYTGAKCDVAQCVQHCANGGRCVAPDTCECRPGWFDANCTTPVCTQTCGNGGNCTAPDTCSCPSEWRDVDCRVPVCSQQCANGGTCIAPNTCLCPVGWSGYDCKLPICTQGLFVPDPSAYKSAQWRPFSFENYVPCDYGRWCNATAEFDCRARLMLSPVVSVAFGPSGRHKTGRPLDPAVDPILAPFHGCLLIELAENALSNYRFVREDNSTSGWFRYSPFVPFRWNASGAPWRGIVGPELGFLPPFNHASDRHVALAEKRNVIQGVYACANGGSCVAPDVCECAPGWIGFDCRTPVCTQGYYVPSQPTYFASDPPEAMDPRQPTSNPTYPALVETLAYDSVSTHWITRGGVRYEPTQGGYACSWRSITQWEKPLTIGPTASPEYYFEHPNYYSAYMDKTTSSDGYNHTEWEGMFWPPLYNLSKPLLDDTRQGWKRGGTWYRLLNNTWQKGKCLMQYQRTCATGKLALDLVTGNRGVVVPDTDASYRPRANYTIRALSIVNEWNQTLFGDCVDHVLRGCYNNGTCVAPDTCRCAPGWTGSDCSVPICKQACHNHGNCTLPDRCTCEIGWTGRDCSIPMCAQECRNGGKCVAPDTCECVTWPSVWRDGRENGGLPVFRKPDGTPQDTGFTGYDCNTPICVQAERFVLNTDRNASDFLSLRGHGKDGTLSCDTHRCPQYDEEVISNDGHSFQSGCSIGNPLPNPIGILPPEEKLANIQNYEDVLNTQRTSDGFLCGNLVWEQGDYTQGRYIRTNYVNITKLSDTAWAYGNSTPGEGVYMCRHKGSCIAPDTCTCGDGYEGIDCQKPSCRFLLANNTVVNHCLNGGRCVAKDTCRCLRINSTLHATYPTAPVGLTGYHGSDCGLPICLQGVFDPSCNASGAAGVDGCYRCKNGGKCVAPDVCECAPGWEGFDCSLPICRLQATPVIRSQLFTVDEDKVTAFEQDPCGTNGGRWGNETINGASIGQGNCTLPSKCTCLCRLKYDKDLCDKTGEFCEKPWKDPFHRSIPPGYVYGTKDCVDGFQGVEDAQGNFMSCHLQIYVPTTFRRYSVSLVALLSVFSVFFLVTWSYVRKRVRRRLLLAKAERRRSRKNSEDNPTRTKKGAFVHAKEE